MENISTLLSVSRVGKSTYKHLADYLGRVPSWEDFTPDKMRGFILYLRNIGLAKNSIKTYVSTLKSALSLNPDVNTSAVKELKAKAEDAVSTFMTEADLARLEKVRTETRNEELTRDYFLVSAYTGARYSDIDKLRQGINENDNYFRYVSKKTGIKATIPAKPYVLHLLKEIGTDPIPHIATFDRSIKRLCKRAGITAHVNIHKAGKTIDGEKWMFVSAHTARRSFATNLSLLGVPIINIARMMGHRNTMQTERYICGLQDVSNTEYFK